MSYFLGTHLNRLDAKGRVSVPALFRASLRALANGAESGGSVILRPAHNRPCIEGWPFVVFQALTTPLERLDLFSQDREDLGVTLYADAYPVEPDKEGRIVLPSALVAHAKLTDGVAFLGMGQIFQIWEPAAAERRRDEAREGTRSRGLTVPGLAPRPQAGGERGA